MVFEVGTATMMAAKGATKPVYEVMAESGLKFNPDAYIAPVKGYYTTTDGKMLSLPYNASTPVLWINKDLMKKAGLNPKMSLKHWGDVGIALEAAKKAGISCGLTTAWQSWIHLENFSAYHDIPFASKANGFAGLNTELKFNSPLHVAHLGLMGKWAKEGKFFMLVEETKVEQTLDLENVCSLQKVLLDMLESKKKQSLTLVLNLYLTMKEHRHHKIR